MSVVWQNFLIAIIAGIWSGLMGWPPAIVAVISFSVMYWLGVLRSE